MISKYIKHCNLDIKIHFPYIMNLISYDIANYINENHLVQYVCRDVQLFKP